MISLNKLLYLITSIDIISIPFYVIVAICLCRHKSEDKASIILQIQILISCILHQFSFSPTYITKLYGKQQVICDIQTFINNFSNFSTLLLGVVIASILHLSASGTEIKLSLILFFSFLCWVVPIISSIFFNQYGDVSLDKDTICWYQNKTITVWILIFNLLISGVTLFLFVIMYRKIKETLLTMEEEEYLNRVKKRVRQFCMITILTFIIAVASIIPFLEKIEESIINTILMILEDFLEGISYPLIAIIYCNHDNLSQLFYISCKKGDEIIRSSLFFYNEVRQYNTIRGCEGSLLGDIN